MASRSFLISSYLKLVNTGCFPVHSIHTTAINFGKRNVRKFPLFHFRWTRAEKEKMATHPDPEIPVYDFGVRKPGYMLNGKFHEVPEMIPDIIVPDLTDCKLKPYVSYKTAAVVQSEFTAQDLFDAVYSRKIEEDWRSNKLDAEGNPLEPSEQEKLSPDEARKLARKTGSDIFSETTPYNMSP